MNLEELKKLCDEAYDGDKLVQGDAFSIADIEFWKAARTYLPKLIAVAEAARKLSDDAYHVDEELVRNVDEALAALEAD
jgi:hypothetical protein